MNKYDQLLLKTMMGKVLGVEPKQIFLEAGHSAEYQAGQWMRQDFQFVDKESNVHYRALLTINVAEIEHTNQLIATMTLPELMALVEEQDDRGRDEPEPTTPTTRIS